MRIVPALRAEVFRAGCVTRGLSNRNDWRKDAALKFLVRWLLIDFCYIADRRWLACLQVQNVQVIEEIAFVAIKYFWAGHATIWCIISNNDADLAILLEKSLRKLHLGVFQGAFQWQLGLLAFRQKTIRFIHALVFIICIEFIHTWCFAIQLVGNRIVLHNDVDFEHYRG